MNAELLKELGRALDSDRIVTDGSMDKYTTFRTGGKAELIVEPQNTEEIKKLVEIFSAFNTPYLVLGNGSNVLASDEGIAVPIIHLGKRMSGMEVFDSCMTAQGGAALSAAASFAAEHSLSGLEFAAGIPGTVGGGVAINAGAYGGELKDVVEAVSFVGPDAVEYAVSAQEMEFGYRTSVLLDSGCIITGVSFVLKHGIKEEIYEKMNELNRRRREKQPLEYPSAGSSFKRPVGYFAGTLIEEAGLKGYAVGEAQVSEKHAGFVINKGGATSADILAVMDHVQRTVMEKNGVMLEPEVRIWGKDI